MAFITGLFSHQNQSVRVKVKASDLASFFLCLLSSSNSSVVDLPIENDEGRLAFLSLKKSCAGAVIFDGG